MDFWDTVRGHRFADIMTQTMPQVLKELRRLNDNLEKSSKEEEKEN